jgi:hypothetical protein
MRNTALYLALNCPDHPGSGLPKNHSTCIYDKVPQAHLALYSAGYDFDARETLCTIDKKNFYFPRVPDRLRSFSSFLFYVYRYQRLFLRGRTQRA